MPRSRREDLIQAATRAFGTHGFRAVGVERLLEEAGVSRMTLYNHFRSKDELIVEVLSRRDAEQADAMRAAVADAGRDPVARLSAAVSFNTRTAADPGFTGCIFAGACTEFADGASQIRRVAAQHKRDLIEYLTQLAVDAEASEPATLADQLFVIIEGTASAAFALSHHTHPGEAQRIAERALAAAHTLIAIAVPARAAGAG